jgi:type I restriction enzyme S subunit
MGKYQAYPKYQESGEEWLGKVPNHWEVIQIKHLSSVKRGASPRPIDDPKYFDEDGEYVWTRIADVTSSDVYLIKAPQRLSDLGSSLSVKLEPESLFLSIAGTVGKPCITGMKACIHDGFVYFPELKIPSKFLFYVFAGEQAYKGLGKFGTQLNLNTDTVGGIKIGCTENEELEKIVNFLDHETAKIDTLIEKQQQLIALLKEKRQAVISHAVTKGLNANAPMRDSGVEWLGEVPEHWKVASLKYLVTAPIIDGPHLTPIKLDEGVPFISAEAISQGYINFDKKWGYISRADHEIYSKRYSPQKDDILMVKLGATTGVVAMVETDKEFNVWVPLATIRIHNYLSSKFVFYLLQSSSVRDAIQLSWTFGTQQTLGLGTLSNLNLPAPSQEESESIVKYIESKIPLYDQSVKKCEVSLGLLQERRTALITAAVTGKIDVRNWQEASLSESAGGAR